MVWRTFLTPKVDTFEMLRSFYASLVLWLFVAFNLEANENLLQMKCPPKAARVVQRKLSEKDAIKHFGSQLEIEQKVLSP